MLKIAIRKSALRAAISLFGLLTVQPVLAYGQAAYDDCMLTGLRDARNAVASNYIQRACYSLYKNGEMLLPREKAYYECILENMPGAREPSAITQIAQICSRRGQL
jgi:hypothetical protein